MCWIPLGAISSRIALGEGATRTGLPLTFIWTDALPSVSSSLDEVSGGITCPAAKVCSLISFVPWPFTRQTYTELVGTSLRVTRVGATVAGLAACGAGLAA